MGNRPKPCVAYAAKSSPDEKDSTADQLRIVREAVEREGGRTVIAEFSEENVSGYRGERGAQLEAAMAAARAAAVEHGESELWVRHSSRVARGDGKKGRRSLLKVYADLHYEDVQLRTVEDDTFVTQPTLIGIASEQNNKYSRDLSAWVTAGKDRQMKAGRRLGGPTPDGLRRVVTVDERQRPQTHYEADDGRVPIIHRMFELSESGMGDTRIAEMLNREGHRTQAGRTWTRRRVQDTLTNPVYAGRVVRYRGKPNEEVSDGTDFPALIECDRFDAIQALRRQRDRSAAGRARAKGGRPTVRYALSRLATCGRCASSMYCVTSPYKRKDGTQARHYVCSQVHDKTGMCNAPKVAADTADAAIVPHLRGFFVDFDAWLATVTASEGADREAIAAHVAESRAKFSNLEQAETRAQDRYAAALADGEAAKIDAIEHALSRFSAEREQIAASIAELEASLSEAETASAPADRLLDFWNDLSNGIRGQLDAAQNVAEVNSALREVLFSVRLDTLDDGRVRIIAIFEDRDEWDPIEGVGPPLYPNTFVADAIPTRPIETGPNSQL
jgi:DNA invertase Pin-like site-specific DNA recombinase